MLQNKDIAKTQDFKTFQVRETIRCPVLGVNKVDPGPTFYGCGKYRLCLRWQVHS